MTRRRGRACPHRPSGSAMRDLPGCCAQVRPFRRPRRCLRCTPPRCVSRRNPGAGPGRLPARPPGSANHGDDDRVEFGPAWKISRNMVPAPAISDGVLPGLTRHRSSSTASFSVRCRANSRSTPSNTTSAPSAYRPHLLGAGQSRYDHDAGRTEHRAGIGERLRVIAGRVGDHSAVSLCPCHACQ